MLQQLLPSCGGNKGTLILCVMGGQLGQPAVPGELHVPHQEEFPHGKGGQALEGAAQGGLESPSLEVSLEHLDVALSALGW